ncbi:hypothetical protein RclHR1_14350006 [Rhizophagus clarus]|uniref:Integrase zinc-binding domain-containing protein n=1 Tax=Rhizophagus clarus TaxID=94130 RepID=A0A2Z6QCI5_9GLOM|nr:hypothetical protein RclHR1_14350006 [Rhizophagus clarus]
MEEIKICVNIVENGIKRIKEQEATIKSLEEKEEYERLVKEMQEFLNNICYKDIDDERDIIMENNGENERDNSKKDNNRESIEENNNRRKRKRSNNQEKSVKRIRSKAIIADEIEGKDNDYESSTEEAEENSEETSDANKSSNKDKSKREKIKELIKELNETPIEDDEEIDRNIDVLDAYIKTEEYEGRLLRKWYNLGKQFILKIEGLKKVRKNKKRNNRMDENEYNRIIKEINKEKKYIIKEGILFRIKNNVELRVIKKYEFEGLMYIAHDHEQAGHFRIKATYNRIKENYYWKGMLKDIEIYVKSCDSCQRRGKPIKKHELNVIKIYSHSDYFTKWPEAKALEKADAKEVARFIYEDIICRHGCPKKILSDRGTKVGNVEDWDLKIPGILLAYRTKKNDSTKIEPGYLIYGRKMKTLLNLEEKVMTIKDRITGLIEELPSVRNKAKESIKKSQENQKKYHDQKRLKEGFNIGDKVLYYDASKEKQWSGKLEEKWKGPYYIHENN